MSHTPGPWEREGSLIWARCEGEFAAKVIAGASALHPSRGIVEYETPRISDSLEEIYANARLIAAAPDLLAACEAANKYIDNACYTTSETQYLVDYLTTAITKAKGEA